MVSKRRTQSRFSLRVRMKRSTQPLPSGSRTKAGELDAEEGDLALEVVGDELAAVIVAQLQAARDPLGEGAERMADGGGDCATITAASSSPTTSNARSLSSASRAGPPSCASPRAKRCVEGFIRTLKENLLWVRRFDTIEDLRLALHAFKDIYNRTWIVERHGCQSPAAVGRHSLRRSPAAA